MATKPKTTPTATEQMRIDLELADNGIILRDPNLEDDVELAVHPNDGYSPKGPDLSAEYRAIGRRIYEWLLEVAIPEHDTELIVTGARLTVKAELTGRAFRE